MHHKPAPRTFLPFSRLPYELQDAIWEASLPSRLVNHNRPIPLGWSTLAAYKRATASRTPWPSPSPWTPDGAPVARARGDHAIPTIAHVCRRARAAVLRHGAWVHSPAGDAAPPAWFDFRRDTVLIEDANALDLLFPPPHPPNDEEDAAATDAAASGAHGPLVADLAGAGAGTDRRHLLANLDRVAGGRLAIAYSLLCDAPTRCRLAHLLAEHPSGATSPLLVYADEIALHGSRAAVAAAARSGLFHGPVGSRTAGAADTHRFRCWRLVCLQDTATLQRMAAFFEALSPAERRMRRARSGHGPGHGPGPGPNAVDPNVAFLRDLMRPERSQKTAKHIQDLCRAELARVDDRPPPAGMAQLLQFQPAVLVWFMVDEA